MRALLLAALVAAPVAAPAAAQSLSLRYTVTSPRSSGGFGLLARVSDRDGDGAGDFVTYASGGGTITFNFSSGVSGDIVQSFTESNDGVFGYPFVEVGDATGDGVPDLVIGAPYETPTPSSSVEVGAAYLYDGASFEQRWRVLSPQPREFGDFGFAAADLGDATGDGRADVLIGEPGENKVHAFDGATGAHLYTVSALTGAYGETLVSLADLDGDGTREVAASGLGSSNRGEVHVLSGATGAELRVITAPLPVPGDVFGGAMAALGDLDGDGLADLAIAASGFDGPEVDNVGRVYAVSAATGAVLRTFDVPAADVASDSVRVLGESLAAGADLDGDGVGDVAATARRSVTVPGGPRSERRVYLFSGATGAVLGWAESASPGPYGGYGGQLALLGGSGGRLVVSASDETVDGVERAGRVYVYGLGDPVASPPPPSAAGLAVAVSPNPSRGLVTLSLSAREAQRARVTVADVMGREVAAVEAWATPDGASVVVDASAWAPGVYVARASVGRHAKHVTARFTVAR